MLYENLRLQSACMQLLGFLLITFGLTWTAWLASASFADPDNAGIFSVGGPVFLLGVFAPALVALALTARDEGREGVRRLVARIGRWQVDARLYAFAVGYMAATKLVAASIHRLVTGTWPVFGDTPVALMLGAILVSTWVQAGEELGWRGYLLPRLAKYMGLAAASVILGGIWASWHLPLFFMQQADTVGQSFPLYLLHVVPVSVAMAWLYWKSGGSLLLVMLMHASVNNTTGIVPVAVAGASDPFTFSASLIGWITVAVACFVALPLLFQMRHARLAS